MGIGKMRIMVTGAAGMLGRAVVAEFQRRGEVVLPFIRRDLDITGMSAVRRVLWQARPQVVINCAAYTDVDGAGKQLPAGASDQRPGTP